MNNWLKDLKVIGRLSGLILGILLTIFIINQFILLYQFTASLHPFLAILVVLLIMGGLTYLVYQIYLQLSDNHRLIEIDQDSTAEEIAAYYQDLRSHFDKHIVLEDGLDIDYEDNEQVVEAYLNQLELETRPMIIENANAIFLTTAISQNGSLDSFVVMYSMLRMVWQLANTYKTRPSLLSLGKLYLQVASVVLMTRTLEDTDLIEYQLEPLITSVIGESIASAIPGLVPISNLIVGSLMEGAVNAFLTLRVGIITQDYLKGAHSQSPQEIRRSASMQSFKYMGTIIKSNSKTIVETFAKTVKKASLDTTKKWLKWSKSEDVTEVN